MQYPRTAAAAKARPAPQWGGGVAQGTGSSKSEIKSVPRDAVTGDQHDAVAHAGRWLRVICHGHLRSAAPRTRPASGSGKEEEEGGEESQETSRAGARRHNECPGGRGRRRRDRGRPARTSDEGGPSGRGRGRDGRAATPVAAAGREPPAPGRQEVAAEQQETEDERPEPDPAKGARPRAWAAATTVAAEEGPSRRGPFDRRPRAVDQSPTPGCPPCGGPKLCGIGGSVSRAAEAKTTRIGRQGGRQSGGDSAGGRATGGSTRPPGATDPPCQRRHQHAADKCANGLADSATPAGGKALSRARRRLRRRGQGKAGGAISATFGSKILPTEF
jgi:hypothetical protein